MINYLLLLGFIRILAILTNFRLLKFYNIITDKIGTLRIKNLKHTKLHLRYN